MDESDNSLPADRVPTRFRRGDVAAVGRVRRRVRRIMTYRGYAIPPGERADLEQEALTQIWRAAGQRDFGAGRSFWGFVDVVATRRCIDWLRTRRRNVDLDEVLEIEEPRKDPLGLVVDGEKMSLARQSIARLPPPCQELIRLRIAQEKSHAEISEILGKSEDALRAQLYRCVRKARRILAGLAGWPTKSAQETRSDDVPS